MNPRSIEQDARELLAAVYRESGQLRTNQEFSDLLQLLSPDAAARLLGIEVVYVDDLDVPQGALTQTRLAGILDRDAQRISISNRFALPEMRFTLAHELGHWRLHDHMRMHRDRPIDLQSSYRRERHEVEADSFASAYLMPRKLVEDAIRIEELCLVQE